MPGAGGRNLSETSESMNPTRLLPCALAAAAALALNACALLRQADSGSTEQTLIAAGFQERLADTPEKVARLQSLPPYKVVPRQQGTRIGYVYADPKQSVLYVGSPAEYRRFQQLSIKQQIAEENEMAAMNNEMATEEWDWDGFGPYWW